ncbi:recombinase family protein [Acinetobacter boissieri]|uniref:Site-specific DNA recombinase n=1 Tax=Acinetobacter boissieri TaxID=1219383 RepID=A0A1G6KHM9_9GAMM|nr:recombinase family protein [Acinetobacter boissieri]SDC30540.1 Site-specific DNA recombinase [Acinetobacter boissieri]
MSNNVGYIRVSSIEQNTDRQLSDVFLDKVFIEKMSAGTIDRPQLILMLDYLRDGDILHVHSIDRLARNTNDLNHLIIKLNEQGVTVYFHKENLIFKQDQHHSAMNKLMFQMLASFAEFERAMIKERQKEGILKAKQKGVYKGRSRKVNYNLLHIEMSKDGASFRKVAKSFGVSIATVQRAMKLINSA